MTENFFARLKRYQTIVNDQKENHATEVLAGCLRLSSVLRSSFLNLVEEKSTDALDWEVRTQVTADKDSRWDLVLENSRSGRLLVIEAKVGDSLEVDQAKKYLDLIKKHKGGKLVALALSGRSVPALKEFRDELLLIRWSEISAAFKATADALSVGGTVGADAMIAEQFIEYLNVEQITMNSRPDDLLGFGPGLRANIALNSLFSYATDHIAKKLGADQKSLKEMHRQGGNPRLCWSNENYYVDLHLRFEGVEGWQGGHTLALGAATIAPPASKDHAEALRLRLLTGWQSWAPLAGGKKMKVATTPATSGVIYAYRPLVGDDHKKVDHQKPFHAWADFSGKWQSLCELASQELLEAITKVSSLAPSDRSFSKE